MEIRFWGNEKDDLFEGSIVKVFGEKIYIKS